jgi:hypothetical protein
VRTLTHDVIGRAAEWSQSRPRPARDFEPVRLQRLGEVVFDLTRRLAADLKAPINGNVMLPSVSTTYLLVSASSLKTLIDSTSDAPIL